MLLEIRIFSYDWLLINKLFNFKWTIFFVFFFTNEMLDDESLKTKNRKIRLQSRNWNSSITIDFKLLSASMKWNEICNIIFKFTSLFYYKGVIDSFHFIAMFRSVTCLKYHFHMFVMSNKYIIYHGIQQTKKKMKKKIKTSIII